MVEHQPQLDGPVNVVLVIADQLRRQALGAYGDPNVSTPHIDALAAEGTTFAAASSTYPVCVPFRFSLITGQYAHTRAIPATLGRASGGRSCGPGLGPWTGGGRVIAIDGKTVRGARRRGGRAAPSRGSGPHRRGRAGTGRRSLQEQRNRLFTIEGVVVV
ncbi:sulfatase-like hydrolase/transferase [Kribbella pittospori]|uniref:sulfatase-like hydrolase/transferase n=1 Tax=Kribbella pittospori TaxID=722689 RepID=UPI003B505C52